MEASGGGDDVGGALFDAEDDDRDSPEGAVPAGHRSIPSWDEAIGMIVDANLATRTDRRRGGPRLRPTQAHLAAVHAAVVGARNRSSARALLR